MIKKLILSLSIMLLTPLVTQAKYCIQVSSVNKIDERFILKKAKSKIFENKANVRVEKIGRYLTLRVGNFNKRSEAFLTLKEIQSTFPDAFVRKCSIDGKDIIYSNNTKENYIDQQTTEITKKKKNFLQGTHSIDLPPNYIYQE